MAASSAKKKPNRTSHQLYLGVDGGGTKTQIAIMNSAADVICEGNAGPSNPLRVGVEHAVSNILTAVNQACDISGSSRGDIVAAGGSCAMTVSAG